MHCESDCFTEVFSLDITHMRSDSKLGMLHPCKGAESVAGQKQIEMQVTAASQLYWLW